MASEQEVQRGGWGGFKGAIWRHSSVGLQLGQMKTGVS